MTVSFNKILMIIYLLKNMALKFCLGVNFMGVNCIILFKLKFRIIKILLFSRIKKINLGNVLKDTFYNKLI